jgi:predicted small secreted protein
MAHTTSRRSLLLIALAAPLVASCNAAIGAGAIVLLGGAGYLASQCYDRVRVRVFDRATGSAGCDADVFVSDGSGSERELRPCYNAALTAGKWTLIARRQGYVTASTELVIPEHEGRCPSYTHTVEFTMRREGEPAEPATVRPAQATPAAAPAAAPNPAGELDTPPSRVVPPPIPTRSFEPLPPAPPAPAPAPGAGR